MNYRHAFHAGNFADVHKHTVLLALIERLKRKPKPIFYLDTHAGRGWYDLYSPEASRGREWEHGVALLQGLAAETDDLRRYVAAVELAHSVRARSYPGSPILAIDSLREGDRAVFVEKQLEEASVLQQSVAGRRGVSIVHGDGFAALRTYLPPRENRGLVMMDPPYESDRDYSDVVRALSLCKQRWPSGIIAIWYPIKAGSKAARLESAFKDCGERNLLCLRLEVRPNDSPLGLNGSALLIANPPWQFDSEIEPTLNVLSRVLGIDGAGTASVEWLVPE